MSLILCTNDCLYQNDGYCTLEQAVTCSLPRTAPGQCVNCVPRSSDQGSQGFPDVAHTNEL